MNLAIKDISYNIGRFVLTAVGIGMLRMVVMGMGGIYRGVVEDASMLTCGSFSEVRGGLLLRSLGFLRNSPIVL